MDKRIERTRVAALSAAIDLLGRRGYAAFTIEAVAAASGIAKSTLYRHWPSKIALIADALETLNVQPTDKAQSGNPWDQVDTLLRHLAEVMENSRFSACLPALIEAAEHHTEVSDFLHGYSERRRSTLADVIKHGVAAGAFRSDCDAEAAALTLSGALFYCRLMTPTPYPKDRIDQLVSAVLGERPGG